MLPLDEEIKRHVKVDGIWRSLGRVRRLFDGPSTRNLTNEGLDSLTPGLVGAASPALGGSRSTECSRWESDGSGDLLHLINDKG